MKVYLSRYSWVWSFVLETMMVGCLFISFCFEVHPFQKATACILGILATLAITKKLFIDNSNLFMTAQIDEDCIYSKLWGRTYCTVSCNLPVYFFFFHESVEMGPPERHYIAISNSSITFAPSQSKILSFDRKKVVLLPDTEETRQVIAPLMGSEFCVLQGDAPPPIEELRKKKENEKEETPVVKREKSPDDPPPFTGKWNGRF